MKVRTMGKIKGRNVKRYIAGIIAVVFACGTAFVPVGAVDEAYAVENDGLSGEYVEGEVIVCYVDSNDMNLTASQEKKAEKLENNAETLMEATDVPLEEVDVDESKITKAAKKGDTVDETIALVESGTKTTEELIAEYSKLPNVASVEPNYIVHAVEGESVSAATEEAADGTVDAGDEGVDSGTAEGTETDSAEAGDGEDTEEADSAGNGEVVEGSEAVVSSATHKDHTTEQWAYTDLKYGVDVPDWNDPNNINAADTVVAVIDTGVDYNHDDLKNVVWDINNETNKTQLQDIGFGQHGIDVSGDSTTVADDPMDDNSHGTHCAGIIAAEWNNYGVSGVANGTKIMAVKVLDSTGHGNIENIIRGYEYINKAKDAGVNIVAVNNSLALKSLGRSDSGLNLAINQAGMNGMVSVFASGNSGANCDELSNGNGYLVYFLKENKFVVSVNNSTKDGKRYVGSDGPSNYGATTTHVFAPGTEISSTVIQNEGTSDPYGKKTGTSMATPVVTGEVAILSAAVNGGVSADILANIVKSNVRNTNEFSGECSSNGEVDILEALNEAKNNTIKYAPIVITQSNFLYNGMEQKPEVTVGSLEKDTDYEVTYTYPDGSSTNAGTYTVKADVKGKGSYKGENNKTFTYTIAKATPRVALSSTYFIYDGGTKSVGATVYDQNGQPWAAGSNYSLSGTTSAKLPGYYTVTASPTDSANFNAASATWRIAVKPTTIKKLSKGSKAFTVKVAKQGKKYVNGYQVRYSLYSNMASAKTKTIGTKYSRVSKKVSKLKKKKTYYVQVRTYKTISGKKYYSDWSAVKTVKTK